MEMPLLEQIYLSTHKKMLDNNFITFISDFRKEVFPRLKAVAVSGQKVKEGEMLFRLQSCSLKNLFIEYKETDEESCFSMRWVMKLKTASLSKLGILSLTKL